MFNQSFFWNSRDEKSLTNALARHMKMGLRTQSLPHGLHWAASTECEHQLRDVLLQASTFIPSPSFYFYLLSFIHFTYFIYLLFLFLFIYLVNSVLGAKPIKTFTTSLTKEKEKE